MPLTSGTATGRNVTSAASEARLDLKHLKSGSMWRYRQEVGPDQFW